MPPDNIIYKCVTTLSGSSAQRRGHVTSVIRWLASVIRSLISVIRSLVSVIRSLISVIRSLVSVIPRYCIANYLARYNQRCDYITLHIKL